MTWYDKIGEFCTTPCDTPIHYGTFHIASLCALVVLTVILCAVGKNWSDKTFRRFILLCWIINLVGEIYIAIAYSFVNSADAPTWSYTWSMFPFQFCSSPMYILPFVAFLKDGKVTETKAGRLLEFASI